MTLENAKISERNTFHSEDNMKMTLFKVKASKNDSCKSERKTYENKDAQK